MTFYTKPAGMPVEAKYLILGEEICPKTNKIHWQAYGEFIKPMRIGAIKKAFNDDTVHLEARKGTQKQAIDYCKKDGKYEEFGEASSAGQRSDLKEVADAILGGHKTVAQLMEEDPGLYMRYRNGWKDIQAKADKDNVPKWRDVKVRILSGPTGCGKTRTAMETAQYKINGTQLKWWNGYEGEKIILIDEYNNDISITELITLIDGYPYRLETKGGFTYAKWDEVIITTNLKLEEIHPNCKPEHKEALKRRIEFISFWDGVGRGAR